MDIREKILNLNREQIRYLYLSSKGYSYQDIADDYGYELVTIQKKFGLIYEDLGFEKFGNRHERQRILSEPGGVYDTVFKLIEKLKEQYGGLENVLINWPPEPEEERPVNLELMAMAIEDNVWEQTKALMVVPQELPLTPIIEEPDRQWVLYLRSVMIIILLTVIFLVFIWGIDVGTKRAASTQVITVNPTGITQVAVTQINEVVAVTRINPTQRPTNTPRFTFTPSLSPTITSTPTPRPTATNTPAPLGLPFIDTFDGGFSDEWIVFGDDPYVVNGELTTDGETTIYVGNETWKNYTVEIVKSWNGGVLELYVRVSGYSNKLILLDRSGDAYWYSEVNGKTRSLTGDMSYSNGDPVNIEEIFRVKVEGDTVELYVDITLWGETTTKTHYLTIPSGDYRVLNSGGIGLKINNSVSIKSVRVYPNP